MPATNGVAGAVAAIAAPLAEELGLEIVDVEFRKEGGRWFLRIFVDRPEGGVSLKDCEALSVPLGRALDERNIPKHEYFLEVSSPGLERVLKKPADFQRFVGKNALVITANPFNGRRRFRGSIVAARDNEVQLEVDGKSIGIPYTAISKANLVFKW
jgi:ribosome maturation factor RimP